MKVLPLDVIREILLELRTVGDIMRFAAVSSAARAVFSTCVDFDPSDSAISALMHGMRSLPGKRMYIRDLPDEYEVPSNHDRKCAPSGPSAKRRVRCRESGEALRAMRSRTCCLCGAGTVWSTLSPAREGAPRVH
ncbi:hypothetical protein DL771_008725 [Monosporascus sp. 5C6A]|nr:hypothetical protein DL771_008725 [Monosporascus sp. 5C6A]